MSSAALQRILLVATIFVGLAGVISCSGSRANTSKSEAQLAVPVATEVATAPAITRELPHFFEATGSLAADEQTDVSPSVAGKVVAVTVDLGSFVKRGQTIARLDDVDLRLRVDQARAQLEQARASLRQAEEKIGFRPGLSFDPESSVRDNLQFFWFLNVRRH